MSPQLTLRDHARSAVRDEVLRRAWMLFSEQGFEATTVDQVAEAAGMSRRTFFRYFAGKDELILQRMLESDELIAAALRRRPPDEHAWSALRAAFEPVVDTQETYADRSRPLLLMLRDEPSARASVVERRRRWQELITPLVAERLPSRRRSGRGPDARAPAVAASALSCLEVAQEAWAEYPGAKLATLLDEAMSAVAPLD